MSQSHSDDSKGVLGCLSTQRVYRREDRLAMHMSTGRVVDAVACHFAGLVLCAPEGDLATVGPTDVPLATENVTLVPQPCYASTMEALKHVVGITRVYLRLCRRCRVILVRGMCPFIAMFYLLAWLHGCRVCHWIIGDPIAMLRVSRRHGRIKDTIGLLYAWQDRLATRVGRWLTGGSFVCNGQELGNAFRSPRTVVTASSTITEDEIYVREDTCTTDPIRILFVGYLRPEKGVQYLLQALHHLTTQRPWYLTLIGPSWSAEYRRELEEIVAGHALANRITWAGPVGGDELLTSLRSADLLVHPTLSEGTPHILVEARAASTPVVSTRVGGVPTSVTDGVDGLLVAPRDPKALAAAMDRVIANGEFRRTMIRNGLSSARRLTVNRFADLIVPLLKGSRHDAPG